jgi:hypothetical protein
VMPGIGPIVADGPLAASLAETAGHVAGGIARTLQEAGLDQIDAEEWESKIRHGSVIVGAHVSADRVTEARQMLVDAGAVKLARLEWED